MSLDSDTARMYADGDILRRLPVDDLIAWTREVEKRLAALESSGKPAHTARGFMCKTDFLYELGNAAGGETVYASVEDLKARRPCTEGCGIVEVEVRLVRVVEEGAGL